MFYDLEGVGRSYIADPATDPLCTETNAWEKVYVTAVVHSQCPVTKEEVESKMKVQLTKFRLKERKT